MPLSEREKWIAIGLGVVVGAYALDAAVLTPLTGRLDAASKEVRDGEAALLAADGLMANELQAKRRWKELTGTTLKADASAAEGQLINRVREVAAGAGLTLESLKPERAPERVGDFQRLTYRAATAGTMRQTSKFLDGLRTADIPLRVTDVQITSRKDGVDDLSLQAGIATVYVLPTEPPKAGAR